MIQEFNSGGNTIVSRTGKVESIFHIKSKFDHDLFTTDENKVISPTIPTFFLWWLKIGYFGLCIPFKPTLEPNSGSHKLQSKMLHKVVLGESFI